MYDLAHFAVRKASRYYGSSVGGVVLDGIQCDSNESNLRQCDYNTISKHDCGHSEEAGVACGGKSKIIIVMHTHM